MTGDEDTHVESQTLAALTDSAKAELLGLLAIATDPLADGARATLRLALFTLDRLALPMPTPPAMRRPLPESPESHTLQQHAA